MCWQTLSTNAWPLALFYTSLSLYACKTTIRVRNRGVARNFRQGVRQSIAFLLSIPVQLPYQVGRTIKKRHDISYRLNDLESIEARLSLIDENIGTSARFHAYAYNTEKSHTKKLSIFLTGCVRPLRHLYGYATRVECCCLMKSY